MTHFKINPKEQLQPAAAWQPLLKGCFVWAGVHGARYHVWCCMRVLSSCFVGRVRVYLMFKFGVRSFLKPQDRNLCEATLEASAPLQCDYRVS